MKVIPFLDWGRWVANCPNPACNNAMELTEGQASFRCGARPGIPDTCGTTADVEWPEETADVSAAFAGTPPRGQSWHPGDDVP